MTRSVSLLFGVHAHQPVGNFPQVIDDALLRSYRPFIRTLYRFPEFLFSIHFSGWLLDYLSSHYPADIELLQEMVSRGQVELFGAGETEPVLAVIPDKDRRAQLNSLSDKLEKKFGFRPHGAWLTERVWESTVIPALHDCGIDYVAVDDYHFLCSGKEQRELNGFFTTEEDGKTLDLFPISEALRYRIPFTPAAETIRYIENMAEDEIAAAAIYFDDIEKFGIWPETYHWVYEQGWLEAFIQGALASSLIEPRHFREYHAQASTRGVVYLPTTSYIEMNEWTLPPARAMEYAALVNHAKTAGVFDRDKSFLRGGIWKNFLSRYPESNWMHKRMLGLSARYHDLPKKQQSKSMRRFLFEAQANDAYWHGLFGGLYLPHLRRAIYRALIELERMLDQHAPRAEQFLCDLDFDGQDEIFIQNGLLQIVLALDGTASIREWDAYFLSHNFADTLARRVEHYHHNIGLPSNEQSLPADAGILSAHDRVSFKHAISTDDLLTDSYPRHSFVDYHLGDGSKTLVSYRHIGSAAPLEAAFSASLSGGTLHKKINLQNSQLSVKYQVEGQVSDADGFITVINLAMPSCDGIGGRFVINNEVAGGFGQPLDIRLSDSLVLQDEVLGGEVRLSVSPEAQVVTAPHFTVSQSEAGFEKIMQALTIEVRWPIIALRTGVAIDMEIIKNAS